MLGRLWRSINTDTELSSLHRSTYRLSILGVALPLALNWIHFRSHDIFVAWLHDVTGWEHFEQIMAIRLVFHVPVWVLSSLLSPFVGICGRVAFRQLS